MRLFEDISKARLNFFNILKNDSRIGSTRTREGPIFYQWKEDQRMHKIDQFFEEGKIKNYTFGAVINCYKRDFSVPQSKTRHITVRLPYLT